MASENICADLRNLRQALRLACDATQPAENNA
jgi:hypothetical protein